MSDTTNAATEIVAEVAEEVADQATQIAEVSRSLSGRDLGLVFSGIVVGVGLGASTAYIFVKRKLETKYNLIAAEEIAEMRQHYATKKVALEAEASKTDLEQLVRNKGYMPETESTEPPMAVGAPASVVEAAQELAEEPTVEETVVEEEPEVRNVFAENVVRDEWDFAKERAKRSPLEPYIIHREERDEAEAYDEVTFTYYAEDDVLCNERDEIIENRDPLVGEGNLDKFGHGSLDANIVYIRNDQLEIDYEIVRSPNSYSMEVHGIQHSDSPRPRRRVRLSDD